MKKLCLPLLLTVLIFVQAAYAAPRIPVYRVDDAYLFFDKNTGEITGFAGEPVYLTIPSFIGGYRVVSIGENAFGNCKTLVSVSIPETVTSIGSGAFKNCTDLSNVNFLGKVSNIPIDAFENTPWTDSGVSEFVVAGGTLLIRYNGSASDVIVPAGVERIAPSAFSYNTAVERVALPEGLIEIGDNAFVHCQNLENIDFPSSVLYIGIGAFDDTVWLRSRTEEFVSINGILIAYNGSGEYVSVPEGIVSLGSGVFMSNDKIKAVYLPQSIRTINEAAFSELKSLCAVYIPDEVQWIADYAFNNSPEVVVFASSGTYAEYYAAINGIRFSQPVNVEINATPLVFDVAPISLNGVTYAPMRTVLEAMGVELSWDGRGYLTASDGATTVTARIDSKDISVNQRAAELESPLIIMSGQTMFPIRAFANIFEYEVAWDGESNCVKLSK